MDLWQKAFLDICCCVVLINHPLDFGQFTLCKLISFLCSSLHYFPNHIGQLERLMPSDTRSSVLGKNGSERKFVRQKLRWLKGIKITFRKSSTSFCQW